MKIKTLILGLVMTAALATATAASACHGGSQNDARANASFNASFTRGMEHGLKLGFFAHMGRVAKLSGTGTSFGGTNASANGSVVGGNDHTGGHFVLGLNTDWAAAQTKNWTDDDGDADDGPVTISCAPSTATVTLSNGTTATSTLTGKACSLTRNGTTTYGFAGMSSDHSTKAFIRESGTTVSGVVFSGLEVHNGLFLGLHFGHKR